MQLSKDRYLESQVKICTATIHSVVRRHERRRVSASSEELAGAEALSWYTSVGKRVSRSPYVIQGDSATVRGQAKLCYEGEPQGGNRQAPEPPDTPGRGVGQAKR